MDARWLWVGGFVVTLSACTPERPDGAYYVHDVDDAVEADGGSTAALDAAVALDAAAALDATGRSQGDATIVVQ